MTIWKPRIKKDRPRYLAIVEALADDISGGRLPEGFQLPTHRELALRLGVSIGTVTRAYASAEQRGLIRGETGRGTFVGRGPSQSLQVDEIGDRARGGINFGMTWPINSENPELTPVLRKLTRSSRLSELLEYQPNAGSLRHRTAGATWVASLGLDVDPDRVVLCSGSQHAITVILGTVASPGDTIVAEELTYPGLRAAAEFLGLKVVGLPIDDDGIIPESFETVCKQRSPRALFCVPTLQNPTSITSSESRRRKLASIAEAHDVAILEDTIHHLLESEPPPLLVEFAPKTGYLIGGPSKVVAGGLRIAYVVPPSHTIDQITHHVWATAWMASPLCAEIMTLWIEDGTAMETVARKQKEAAARVELARNALPDHLLQVGDHSYHAWLQLPDEWTSATQFVDEALRRGVTVTAADAFHIGIGAAPKAVRISLSAPTHRSSVELGLETLAATLKNEPNFHRVVV